LWRSGEPASDFLSTSSRANVRIKRVGFNGQIDRRGDEGRGC